MKNSVSQENIMEEATPVYLIDALLAWHCGNVVYYTSLGLLAFIALFGLIIRQDILRAQWGFIALAIALLPAMAEYLTKVIFPWPMKFLITLSLILHIAGGIFGFYFSLYPLYDKIGHLISSMAIAFVFFVMIMILAGLTGKHVSRTIAAIGIFVPVILFALAWEYAELNIDIIAGSTYYVDANDSFFDMVFNIIGASYIVLNIHAYMKKESLNSLYRRFIRWKN
jgi:hypothetical protein